MNVVLIGYRGTGKTTVARLLGALLGWPWLDADREIEARAGKTITRIFADDGEPAFRDWETQVVAELCGRGPCVLALGGGAVMRPENRAAITQPGNTVVWLTGEPETLWQRIQADRATAAGRPDLTAQGGITEIIATLDARRAVYRQCAQFEVDTENRTPQAVAETILARVSPSGSQAS